MNREIEVSFSVVRPSGFGLEKSIVGGLAVAAAVVVVVEEAGSNSTSAGLWISADQALARVSVSNPSRNTRILPQESQLEGMRILSRSMMLGFMEWGFSGGWMWRVEWMRGMMLLLGEKEVV